MRGKPVPRGGPPRARGGPPLASSQKVQNEQKPLPPKRSASDAGNLRAPPNVANGNGRGKPGSARGRGSPNTRSVIVGGVKPSERISASPPTTLPKTPTSPIVKKNTPPTPVKAPKSQPVGCKFCTECGVERVPNSKFCGECGQRF